MILQAIFTKSVDKSSACTTMHTGTPHLRELRTLSLKLQMNKKTYTLESTQEASTG